MLLSIFLKMFSSLDKIQQFMDLDKYPLTDTCTSVKWKERMLPSMRSCAKCIHTRNSIRLTINKSKNRLVNGVIKSTENGQYPIVTCKKIFLCLSKLSLTRSFIVFLPHYHIHSLRGHKIGSSMLAYLGQGLFN